MASLRELPHLEGYMLAQKLGEGTSGEVWKATKEKETFALKILKPGYETTVLEEFNTLRKLEHPNIVKEYEIGRMEPHLIDFPENFDAGALNGRVCLVMELLNGKPMDKANAADYSPEELENMTLQLAHGLRYAHSQGIIHRDLKPANIFISPEKKITLLDFGVSSAVSYNPNEKLVAGSYSYMAPAQLLGKANLQNDIWSFGVTLYQFLSGIHPYHSTSLEELSEKMLLLEVDFPNHLSSRVSPKLSYVLKKCLRKNVRERYRDFQEVIEDLEKDPVQAMAEAVKFTQPQKMVRVLIRRHRAKSFLAVTLFFGSFGLAIAGIIFSSVLGLQIGTFPLWLAFLLLLIASLGMGAWWIVMLFFRETVEEKEDMIRIAPLFSASQYRHLVKRLQETGEQNWDREDKEYLASWNEKEGFPERAESLAAALLEEDKNNMTALAFFVRRHYQAGQLQEARNYCLRLIQLNPGDVINLFYEQVLDKTGIAVPKAQSLKVDQVAETVAAPSDGDGGATALTELDKEIFRSGWVKMESEITEKNAHPLWTTEKELLEESKEEETYHKKSKIKNVLVPRPVQLVLYENYLENLLAGQQYFPDTITYDEITAFSEKGALIEVLNFGWIGLAFKSRELQQEWGRFLAGRSTDVSGHTVSCHISELNFQPFFRQYWIEEESKEKGTYLATNNLLGSGGKEQEIRNYQDYKIERIQRPFWEKIDKRALFIFRDTQLEAWSETNAGEAPMEIPYTAITGAIEEQQQIRLGSWGWARLQFEDENTADKWGRLIQERTNVQSVAFLFCLILRKNLKPFYDEQLTKKYVEWERKEEGWSFGKTLSRDSWEETEQIRKEKKAGLLLHDGHLEIVSDVIYRQIPYEQVRVAFGGRMLSLDGNTWLEIRFDDPAALAKWNKEIHQKPLSQDGFDEQRFSALFEESPGDRAKEIVSRTFNQLSTILDMALRPQRFSLRDFIKLGGRGILLLLAAFLVLILFEISTAIGGISLAIGLVIWLVPRFVFYVWPPKGKRFRRWYKRYQTREVAYREFMKELLKNAFASKPTVLLSKDKLRARPFRIDLRNELLSYGRRQSVQLAKITRFVVSEDTCKLYVEEELFAEFPFQRTAYEKYLPVFCHYWADRIEF